jgi:hypothetical protein
VSRWRIEFRDAHGEGNVGTLIVEADNLVKAKQHAVRVCRRRLAGGGEGYLEAKGHYTYRMMLGQDEAGEARIARLGPGQPNSVHALRVPPREPRTKRGAVGRSWSGPRRGTEPVPHLCLHVGRREVIQ